MGEANSLRVALVQRTSFATPAALDLLALQCTGQDMRHRQRKVQSQTLRNDANIGDLIRLDSNSGGGIDLEFVFPAVNEALWFLLRAALRATEDAERTEAACTTTAGAKTITKAAIDFTAGNPVQVGDLVRVSGTPSDDGVYPASAVAATTVTVVRDSNFVGAAGTATLRRGARMIDGTQRFFFDVEIARLDVGLYQLFRQCVVNQFELTIAEDILRCRVQLLGGTPERASSTYALSVTNPAVAGVFDHLGVPDIRYNDLAASSKQLSLSINNNIVANTRVGLDGVDSFSWGSKEITTRWTGYLASWNEMNDSAANTARRFWFAMRDAASRMVSVSLPDHKWLELSTPTRGLNQTDYIEGSGQSVALNQSHGLRLQRWA